MITSKRAFVKRMVTCLAEFRLKRQVYLTPKHKGQRVLFPPRSFSVTVQVGAHSLPQRHKDTKTQSKPKEKAPISVRK